MKLTDNAITKISKPTTRLKLALALGFTEGWINTQIKQNKPNGPLTLAAALKVIKKETGLKETEILEESKVEHQVKSAA